MIGVKGKFFEGGGFVVYWGKLIYRLCKWVLRLII